MTNNTTRTDKLEIEGNGPKSRVIDFSGVPDTPDKKEAKWLTEELSKPHRRAKAKEVFSEPYHPDRQTKEADELAEWHPFDDFLLRYEVELGPVLRSLDFEQFRKKWMGNTIGAVFAKERRRLLEEAEEAETADSFLGEDGSDFDPEAKEPVPSCLEVGDRYLFVPGVHYIYGHGETFKTWLMLFTAVQEMEKGHWVWIFDYEMGKQRVMRRLYQLGATPEDLKQRFKYSAPKGPLGEGARRRILAQVEQMGRPPGLVIIDSCGPAVGITGGDENSGSAVAAWIESFPMWMKGQWDEAIIAVIDHLRKDATRATVQTLMGSGRKGHLADGLWATTSISKINRKVAGRVRLSQHKDRDGYGDNGQAVADITFGGGTRFVVTTPDLNIQKKSGSKETPESKKAAIARYVKQLGPWHKGKKDADGKNPHTIDEIRTVLGINSNDFSSLKDELIAEGVVISKPRYGLVGIGPNYQDFINSLHEDSEEDDSES